MRTPPGRWTYPILEAVIMLLRLRGHGTTTARCRRHGERERQREWETEGGDEGGCCECGGGIFDHGDSRDPRGADIGNHRTGRASDTMPFLLGSFLTRFRLNPRARCDDRGPDGPKAYTYVPES